MITLIRKILNTFFLVIFLLLSAPTLLFLTKWYYSNLVMHKTYIGVVDIPFNIDKSEETILAARTLFGSPDIKAIIINCDGQGGNPGACQAIYADFLKLKQLYKKPMIAFIEKECLGANYLIASTADYIISTEGAVIGYLGSFSQSVPKEVSEQTKNMYSLEEEYKKQYYKNIIHNRKLLDHKKIISLENTIVTGNTLLQLGLVDFLGATLEIERLLKTKAVIEGSIEKVHGSFLEHFIFYITDLINRTMINFKKKENAL